MDNVQYTLVVTSCGRHDLLHRTLLSFAKYADILPEATVIIEDGPDTPNLTLGEYKQAFGDIKVITNGKRKGQIYSVDRAYAEVKTEYIFHCEDDWEFKKSGFIKESFDLLSTFPDLLTISLRTDWQHPILKSADFDCDIVKPNWDGGWGGFSFNPGLRRMSDYYKIGSYGKHVGYNPFEVGELYLSKLYLELGYKIGSLYDVPYVEHIGWGDRHVEWKTAPKPPKVLIAIPMCWAYEYKDQADGNIHKDNKSTSRIEAQRSSWLKDLQAFKSYVDFRYFYGNPNFERKGTFPREPKADEIFLNVPDDYKGLTYKMKGIFDYALANGYDHLFKTDDDTFVYVDRLLASGYENYDYTGYCTNNPAHPPEHLYASGGSGYWLSRKAMEVLVKANPDDWAEDRWVGKTLYANGIKVVRDARYLPGFREHYVQLENLPKNHSYITLHAVAPEKMSQVYEQVVSPNFTLINKAIGDDYDGDDPRCEYDNIMAEILGDMADLNKDLKNKILQISDRVVKLLIAERRRLDILEQRIDKYNQKASHKI